MVDQWTSAGQLGDELTGSLAARKALGADNEAAVVDAFLQRAGHAIDARVEAHLATAHMLQQPATARTPGRDHRPFVLAVTSLIAAIPITAICTQIHPSAFAIVAAWAAIVVLNVVYNVNNR